MIFKRSKKLELEGTIDPDVYADTLRKQSDQTTEDSVEPAEYGSLEDYMAAQKVKDLQRELNSKGANLKVDGIRGPKTDAAYQKLNASNSVIFNTPLSKERFSSEGYWSQYLNDKGRPSLVDEARRMAQAVAQASDPVKEAIILTEGGIHKKAYYATANERKRGILTIGAGSTSLRYPEIKRKFKEGDLVPYDVSMAYLTNDLRINEGKARDALGAGFDDLPQMKRAAVVSTVHNQGKIYGLSADAFRRGDIPGFVNEMWGSGAITRQKGKRLDGLVKRRLTEELIWNS